MKDKLPVDEILRLDQPWPLKDILAKLIEASDILLHDKNYDGHGWENISHATEEAKKIKALLEPPKEEKINYYKTCPFIIGKTYNIGVYKGRYDGWDNRFGSFRFVKDDEATLIHPIDHKAISNIKEI